MTKLNNVITTQIETVNTKQTPLLQTDNVTEGTDTTQNIDSTFASVIVSKKAPNVNDNGHLQPKMVKLSVDYIGYQSKPTNYLGKITNRIKDTRNVKEITLKELSKKIITGHAFTNSYANTGVKDKDFISADIVCLDFDGNISIQEVLSILEKNNIIANIIYYTYSHGEKGERFRVITALNETITDKDEYKCIIKGYMSLFDKNVDNATVGLVQRFLGTNKGLARDVDETSTTNKQIFLDLYKKICKTEKQEQKPQETQKNHRKNININDFDLQKEIDNYNLLDYIKQTYPTSEFKHASGGVYVNPCPLCGHNDHLHITGNKFHSFGNKACLELGGVGIVQWLQYSENLTIGQAIAKFKYELLGIDEKQDKRAYAQTMAQKNISEPQKEQEKEKPPFIEPIYKHGDLVGEKISSPLLAEYIRNDLNFFYVKDGDFSEVLRFVYRNGFYNLVDDKEFMSIIKTYITQYNRKLLKMTDVKDVLLDLSTDGNYVNATELDADENIINFKNGILRLDTMTLEPHSPDIKSTIQIDCEWSEKDIETPIYDNYIKTLVNSDTKTIHFLNQYAGVALSNICGYKMKQSLFMIGEGDSGKSQYKLLLEYMLGNRNCCAIDLKTLERPFALVGLYRKRLAGTADMSYMKISELSNFKNITGGDLLRGEAKGKDAFNFRFNGVLLFCANKKPHFGGDTGDHVYRRMIFVDCPNKIPEEKQDKNLLNKMKLEYVGIVRKWVLALKTVIDAGYRYDIPEKSKESLEKFKIENDSVLSFISECVVKRLTSKLDNCTTKIMYEVYKEWCKNNNNGHYESNPTFKRTFTQYFGYKEPEDAVIKYSNTYYKDYTISIECKKDYCNIYGYDSI